jgi:acyl-CoA thioester hydrolase
MGEFVYPLRVRFCEVDEYGFVWHGHYLAWFEAARVEMLREVDLTPARLLERGYLVPVVDIRIACKKPIKSDSEVAVFCSIEPTEKALLTFHYRLVEAASGETCATGSTTHVLMNRRETLLYLLPEEIREPLERLIAKYPAAASTGEKNGRPSL